MIFRLGAILTLLLVTGCSNQPPIGSATGSASREATAGATVAKAADGASAPTVDVKVLDHQAIQQLIASHQGKVVVMDCWSTSCEPCVKEFPNLVALHKKHGPDKVACISLSFDYEGLGKPEDVLPTVRDFLVKQGAAFDNVLCRDDSESLYKKMNLASVPAVYVYKPDGELAKRFDNENAANPDDAFNYEHVGKLVDELIAGK